MERLAYRRQQILHDRLFAQFDSAATCMPELSDIDSAAAFRTLLTDIIADAMMKTRT